MLKENAEKIVEYRFWLLASGASGERGQNWSVKYVRGYERSSICPLSTILPLAANPSPIATRPHCGTLAISQLGSI